MRLHPRGLAVHTAAAASVPIVLLALPAAVSAHGLAPVYRSPLPLAVYLAGAGAAVALSFVLILARNLRAAPSPAPRPVRVPRAIWVALRALGLAAWAWIMLQGVIGGGSAAAVAPLFLWIYGWVGLAVISALLGPAWEWLDPFATLHDMLAWIVRRIGVKPRTPTVLPRRARHWPAVAGFVFFVWVELVPAPGSQALTIVLAAYTVLTLALMAQYGRDRWRGEGEVFSVWFRTLNRLAPYGVARRDASGAAIPARLEDTPDASIVVRRPFASGLIDATWTPPVIVLVALGTASIIFDSLSQTVAFAAIFGAAAPLEETLLLVSWLGLVSLAALWVARAVSPGAIGAALLPIAVGYLIAHYLTWLLVDGQTIVIALSDPLEQGWDLLGTSAYEPSAGWLPPGLVWTMQLAAVVGGHMLGAWAGHVTALRDLEVVAPGSNGNRNGNGDGRVHRDIRHRTIRDTAPLPTTRHVRAREVPLAIVMISLTVVTLWSLGQAIVVDEALEGVQTPAMLGG